MGQDFSGTGKYHISTEFAGIYDLICRPGHLSSTMLHLQLYVVTHFTFIKNLQPLQFGYCTRSYCHNSLIIILFYKLKFTGVGDYYCICEQVVLIILSN